MKLPYDFIAIGCDPELFAKSRGRFVSVHDLLPGTKTMPCKVPKGAVQVDGVAAEFNIDPCKTEDEFVDNIKTVRGYLNKILDNAASGLTLVAEPTATFGQNYFDSLPFSAKQLGCEPDYSAYTKKPNPRPETTEPFRTGSGHVHIQMLEDGWFTDTPHGDKHFEDCCILTRDLDVSLFMASKFWDKDTKRMSLYGNPGAFRPKTYGVEYRVLSNAWLSSEKTMRYVHAAAKETAKRFLQKEEKSLDALLSPLVEFDSMLDYDEYNKFLHVNGMPTPSDYSISPI